MGVVGAYDTFSGSLAISRGDETAIELFSADVSTLNFATISLIMAIGLS
jgi:hypothetical protein